jgi:hypothetical protein
MAKMRVKAPLAVARELKPLMIEIPLIDLAQWTVWATDLFQKLENGSKLEDAARNLWMCLMAPLPLEGYMLMDALAAKPQYLQMAHKKGVK